MKTETIGACGLTLPKNTYSVRGVWFNILLPSGLDFPTLIINQENASTGIPMGKYNGSSSSTEDPFPLCVKLARTNQHTG